MWTLSAIVPFVIVVGLTIGYRVGRKKVILPVRFVSEKDKKKILEAHGVKLDQTTKCSVCGETINLDNLGALKQTSSGVLFICSKSDCMKTSLVIPQ